MGSTIARPPHRAQSFRIGGSSRAGRAIAPLEEAESARPHGRESGRDHHERRTPPASYGRAGRRGTAVLVS